jgi:hypothetical protein
VKHHICSGSNDGPPSQWVRLKVGEGARLFAPVIVRIRKKYSRISGLIRT